MLNSYFYNCFNHKFPALQNSDFAGKFESLNNVNCPEELLCAEDVVFTFLLILIPLSPLEVMGSWLKC